MSLVGLGQSLRRQVLPCGFLAWIETIFIYHVKNQIPGTGDEVAGCTQPGIFGSRFDHKSGITRSMPDAETTITRKTIDLGEVYRNEFEKSTNRTADGPKWRG